MEQAIEGVYSRMYSAMADHQQGLISFDEMLNLWKKEAKMVKEMLTVEQERKGGEQAA